MDFLQILLVHDDLLVHHIAADAMRYCGVELVIAENHVEGIQALRTRPIDALIVELSRITDGGRFLRKAFALRPLRGWVQILDPMPCPAAFDYEPAERIARPPRCADFAAAVMGLVTLNHRRAA